MYILHNNQRFKTDNIVFLWRSCYNYDMEKDPNKILIYIITSRR